MKKSDDAWRSIHNLVSMLNQKDVEIIDNYYRGFGNTAPGELYRAYLKEIYEYLYKCEE